MKVAIVSDIHLEFGDLILENKENADVLILAGDICVAADLGKRDPYNIKAGRIVDFFTRCSEQFPIVLYIMGNHEHYHGDFAKSLSILQEQFSDLKNVLIMDKEYVILDEIVFFCGTLWTDMNKEDRITMYDIKSYMNDFRTIKNSNRGVNYKAAIFDKENPESPPTYEFRTRVSTFSPDDAVEDHKAFIAKLGDALKEHNKRFVVVGHHAPSKLSTHPRYKDEYIVNGAYSSDLSDLMLDNPNIKLWVHGHTHEPFDYMIGSTRIVCNPRGYIGYEKRADEFELKYYEVE